LSKKVLVGRAARIGEVRNAYIILVGQPERKKPFRTHRERVILECIVNKQRVGMRADPG
jgi:hypothetical protein